MLRQLQAELKTQQVNFLKLQSDGFNLFLLLSMFFLL